MLLRFRNEAAIGSCLPRVASSLSNVSLRAGVRAPLDVIDAYVMTEGG